MEVSRLSLGQDAYSTAEKPGERGTEPRAPWGPRVHPGHGVTSPDPWAQPRALPLPPCTR